MGHTAGFLTPKACKFTSRQASSYSLVYPDKLKVLGTFGVFDFKCMNRTCELWEEILRMYMYFKTINSI